MSWHTDVAGRRAELDGEIGSAVLPHVVDSGASVAPWWLVAGISAAVGAVLVWVVLWQGGRR